MLQHKTTTHNATLRWANNRHVLIRSQQCKTLHLNVSGLNNVKADYANWGYRGHCNLTMAPSWLDCVCVCICVSAQPIPLGFVFSPTVALPQNLYPMAFLLRPHYGGRCQSVGQGSWQRFTLINAPQSDQSTCLFISTNRIPACIKTIEWEEKRMSERIRIGRTSPPRWTHSSSFFPPKLWNDIVEDTDDWRASSWCTCNALGVFLCLLQIPDTLWEIWMSCYMTICFPWH